MLLEQFEQYGIEQIPGENNSSAYSLAKLASTEVTSEMNAVPIGH